VMIMVRRGIAKCGEEFRETADPSTSLGMTNVSACLLTGF
jgi:hypothetical protein